MLGLVHRTVLGQGPPHFRRFFKRKPDTTAVHWTRSAKARHHRQLEEVQHANCPGLLRRSAFGLVKVYNLLPREVVAEDTVPEFQKRLQRLVKTYAAGGRENWQNALSPREAWWNHPLRQRT